MSRLQHVLCILELFLVSFQVHRNTLVLGEQLLVDLSDLVGRCLFTELKHLDAVLHVLNLLSELLLHFDLSLLEANELSLAVLEVLLCLLVLLLHFLVLLEQGLLLRLTLFIGVTESLLQVTLLVLQLCNLGCD